MKRLLVTGATGFLGRHVVERLVATGHAVTAHGRSESPFDDAVAYLRGDLADENSARVLERDRWDAVINLAGPVTGGAEDLATGIDVVTAHVRIALHIRKYLSAARIVHASSMTVYDVPAALPVTEEHPRRPRHLYGLGKMLAEDVLLSDHALDVWVLRLPGLFSETRSTGALHHFCSAARTGKTLRVTASTPTAWDVLHVEDAAEAILAAAAAPSLRGGAINVSYGERVDLVGVARRIAAIAGTGSSVENSGPEHPAFQLSNAKAAHLLEWSPPTLEARLARLYTDYGAQ